MKKLIKLSFLFVFGITLFVACNKDEPTPTENNGTITIDPPLQSVLANVYGKVVDENDETVSDIEIVLGTRTANTDENGYFRFNSVPMNGYGQVITVDQTGYYKAIKMIETETDGNAYVEFKLMKKNLVKTVMSDQESEISVEGESKLMLPANAFQDSNGNAYTGEVNVYSTWMDPTSTNTMRVMPGDLRAVDGSSDIVQLATYGMLAVELESPTGEELNLADGSEAELTFDVPAELEDNAPETIPMWYFDEASGYWVEEGEATLVDGVYVGNVTHFSFWNCDAPFPLVNMTGQIIDTRNIGLANMLVEITFPGSASVGTGWTDSDGFYYGKIPANEVLTIKIYDACGELIFEDQIGPYATDVTIQPIVVQDNTNNILFEGTVADCDGNPVSNGYVLINGEGVGQSLFVEADGTFSGIVNVCGLTEVSVKGVDLDNNLQSQPEVYPITTNEVQVGVISTCDELDQYFYFNIDGQLTAMNEAYAQLSVDSLGQDYYYLSGSLETVQGFPTIGIVVDNGPGDYNPDYVLLFTEGDEVYVCSGGCDDFVVSFSAIGPNDGDLVKCTFSGLLELGNGTPAVQVDGAFKSNLQ